MKTENSQQAFIATSFIPRLNSNLCLPLIEKCGGIEGFFEESDQALSSLYKTFHISANLFDRKTALEKAKEEAANIEKHDIQICSIENNHYPELLKQCEDAPLVFYYKGIFAPSDSNKYLAIVGTRHASSRCQARVESLVAELCALNCRPVIVSGLAYGIDASAHRASLKNGLPTFAVLGHGLHMIYPASHKTLAENILNSGGALLSEFPCTAPVHPQNFLRRNRIIAGLCHATLIAESAQKGGAMSTARLALSYNRDVMALPGRPEDLYSSGCNLLIKENIAALIDNAMDIARILNFPISQKPPQQIRLELFDTSEKETILLAVLKEHADIHIDELHQCISIPPGELSALLLQLELEGKILALPGKKYTLAP